MRQHLCNLHLHRVGAASDLRQFLDHGIIVESRFSADGDSGKQIFLIFLFELADFFSERGSDNLGNDAANFFLNRRAVVAHMGRLR